ncbi:MAG: hypothetical protein ACFFB3_19495 [Candidatus Hodarchaeota archaeon]
MLSNSVATFVPGRRYWQRYLAAEPKTLRLSRRQKRVLDAMALKESPRIGEKAEAQKLLRQIIDEPVLSPDLTIYAMLNLCDLLLEEAKAYGAEPVLEEADRLSARISDIALSQDSPALRVEALLLRSKFALLQGSIPEADKLLGQAAKIAEDQRLPKLADEVAREQAALATEVGRWEELIARAAPLRERLEQARLQDYIADAVKLIAIVEATI